MSDNKLNVIDLHKRYGEHEVLKGVSLQAKAGDVISIIGSSGSGKSTFLRCINFLEKPSEGTIVVSGQNIGLVRDKDGQLKVADKNQLRLLRTRLTMVFQHFNLWSHMTVLENVMVGLDRASRYSLLEAALHIGRYFPAERAAKAKAMAILEDIGIAHFAHMQATNLSYGNQRKVEIARALATAPKLLLLDEPAAGMNPKETEDLAELIFHMRHDYQLSVLLIEHDMPFVNRLCERVMVLEYGKPLFSGLMAEAIQHPDVISAYLGEANYA